MSTKYIYYLCIFLSVIPVYLLNVAGFSLSLYQLLSLIILAVVMWNVGSIYANKEIVFFLLFVVVVIFSAAWSIDKIAPFVKIFYFSPFVAFLFMSYRAGRRFQFDSILTIIQIYVLAAFLNAIAVIIFYFQPDLEAWFFMKSRLASLFANNNLLDALRIGDIRNNFFDVGKSGGVFVNANIGAVYNGLGFVSALFLVASHRQKLLNLGLAIVLGVSILFSGSKISVLLLIFCFLYIFRIKLSAHKRIVFYLICIVLGIVVLFVFGAEVLIGSKFGSGVVETSGVRFLLWAHALQLILSAPILGVGHGAWMLSLPPHNTMLQLWIESGFFSVLFASLFIVSVLKSSHSLSKNVGIMREIAVSTMLCVLWITIQGMGSNGGIVGAIQCQSILGVYIGLLLSLKKFA